MSIKNLILPFLLGFLLSSCGEDEMPAPSFSFTERLSMDNIKNIGAIVESPAAHSGRNVAHVDSGKEWGLIYVYTIPDSLVGKQMAVSVDAWVKAGATENPGDIVCSITNQRDSILAWYGFGSKSVITTPNQWANLTSTLTIPREITSKPNITLSIICYNSKLSYFDVDDLNIHYFEVNP